MIRGPDYSFVLYPRTKKRCNAGTFDREKRQPSYELDVHVPKHVQHEVETKQFLIKTGDGYLWIWDIENNSSWPAFITVFADGKIVKNC